MQLHDGDFTFQKTFTLVERNAAGDSRSASFKPEKGKEFITMLVGEIKIGAPLDIDAMMARIGLVCDDKGAKEILQLKSEIAELQRQLAEALAAKAA
jgi:hypothetical protein